MAKLRLIFFLLVIPWFLYANSAVHIKINSSISPATTYYLKDALKEAKMQNASFIMIELDTPGGLASSMRDMIQLILNSSIPVVTHVSPKGARAASAGTFLLYASHVAVMAEGTNIGAATPVNMLQSSASNKQKETKPSAMEKKVLNDAVAYIKSLAQLRNRDVKFAIDAVKEGKSISAKEALENNVIDFIANNINDLIDSLHTRLVLIDENVITLDTQKLDIKFLEPSVKVKFLMIISNANVAYIFLLLAMYGILFELMNPGSIVPGVIGAISGAIALYALNILPFNYVGLILIILGIGFMAAELFITGLGILGIGGVIAFVIGSFMLFDEAVVGSAVSTPLILGVALFSILFFMYILKSLYTTRKEKSRIGIHNLINQEVFIEKQTSQGYKISINGEIWDAISDEDLSLHQKVKIIDVQGLVVKVRSLK